MLAKKPFDYFDSKCIEKLHKQWSDTCSLKEFEENCRAAKWGLYQTCLSYFPPVPAVDSVSFFGEPIDLDKEYLYEHYELLVPYERITCTVYYRVNKEASYGERDKEAVAVCFYDS